MRCLSWRRTAATLTVLTAGCLSLSSSAVKLFGQDAVRYGAPNAPPAGGYYAAEPQMPVLSAPATTRLPNVSVVSMSHVMELEARLAEVEAQLAKQSTEKKAEKKDDKPADDGYVVGSDLSMTAKWNHGLEVSSKNKDFRIHVGGRTQVDTSAYSGSGNVENPIAQGGLGPLMNATNFRRGRLRVDGTMYEVIEFACEYDFINEINVDPGPSLLPPQNNPSAIPCPTDLWVDIHELPILQNVRIGNQKDPYGFEHQVSSRYLDFMERSYAQDAFEGAFNNGFLPGIQAYGYAFDDRLHWAIGEFANTNNIFGNAIGDGELETAGRLAYLPVYQDDGRYLIHTGIAGTHKDLDEDQIRFRSRGNIRSGAPSSFNPVFANTGNIQGSTEQQIGVELASVWGPWTFCTEYFGTQVNDAVSLGPAAGSGGAPPAGTAVGTYYAQCYYVEALYFLTGESRGYDMKRFAFGRVIPHENFFFVRDSNGCSCGGWGAWQVGFRYSYLDLNNSGINGGILHGYTAGLNWFLNPNMKVQWNYDLTTRDFVNDTGFNGSGDVHSFGMRFAFDF